MLDDARIVTFTVTGNGVDVTESNPQGARESQPLQRIFEFFQSSRQPATVGKDKLPWFYPATFRGDYRKGANLEQAWAIGFDVDEAPIPSEDELASAVQGLGLAGWFHSSPNATPDAPRWHLFVLVDRPITSTDEYKRAHIALRARLPFKVGTAASDASRGWTVPRESPHYLFRRIDGSALDVDAILADAQAGTTSPPTTAVAPMSSPVASRRVYELQIGAAALAACPHVGRRHELARDLSGVLCSEDSGVNLDEVPDFVERALCDVAGFGARKNKRGLAEGAVTRKRAGETLPGWPTLQSKWPGLYEVHKAAKTARENAFRERMGVTSAAAMAVAPGRWKTPAERARTLGSARVRLATGFPTLDAATRGGFPVGTVVAIGGAPGAGKTTTVVQLAYRYAKAGTWVAILASDESAAGLLVRIGQIMGHSREALETGEQKTREAFASALESLPLILVDADEDGASLEDVSAELRQRAGDGPSVLILDSLQTVPSKSTKNADNPRSRIDAVVGAVKMCAKVDRHLVIATSELARGSYRSQAAAEQVNDLAAFKESGGIEYGVGVALVLRSRQGAHNMIDVKVPKNRIGNGRPEFTLLLSAADATVAEVTIPPVDPMQKWKASVMAIVDEMPGRTWSKSALALAAGGRRDKTLAAINDLVEGGLLLEEARGISSIPNKHYG